MELILLHPRHQPHFVLQVRAGRMTMMMMMVMVMVMLMMMIIVIIN